MWMLSDISYALQHLVFTKIAKFQKRQKKKRERKWNEKFVNACVLLSLIQTFEHIHLNSVLCLVWVLFVRVVFILCCIQDKHGNFCYESFSVLELLIQLSTFAWLNVPIYLCLYVCIFSTRYFDFIWLHLVLLSFAFGESTFICFVNVHSSHTHLTIYMYTNCVLSILKFLFQVLRK